MKYAIVKAIMESAKNTMPEILIKTVLAPRYTISALHGALEELTSCGVIDYRADRNTGERHYYVTESGRDCSYAHGI